MDLHITFPEPRDLSGQLYRQLREAILDGRLRAGEALPSTRELAARLEVSRNTVTNAYTRLESEGFLRGRMGAGTFVEAGAARATATRHAPAGDVRARSLWDGIAAFEAPTKDVPYDFRIGVPDARLFPATAMRRLVAREIQPSRLRAGRYGDSFGEPSLRESVARHIGVSRSVQADADDVIITNGAQQGFDLIARVLVEPGACVAVEDPGYPMARLAFETHGARVVPVPVDAEGIVVDALPAAAKVVYVTPSHQFPLGSAMSLERRMQLLAWAERRRCAIVEDDYDSEFRFTSRALEPLQSLDRSGRVLYVGSFSKVLLPALRLGYVVPPKSLRAALGAARMVSDWYGPTAVQTALARFIDEGGLARHIRAARREYQARRDRLTRALVREAGLFLEAVPGSAGLHMSAVFRDPHVDAERIAERALERGVSVRSIGRFAMAPARAPSGLVLGYGAIGGAKIDEGVRRLAACMR